MAKNNQDKSPNNSAVLIGLGVLSVAILILGAVFTSRTSSPVLGESTNANVEIQEPLTHDWGEIDINGGNVERVFNFKNTGQDPLQLTNFKTSCMCTEVQVTIDGEESPIFGMHTRSAWKGTVEPGGEGLIRVVFDPLYHGPAATGPITRLVSFETNDADNQTVELRLSGNVVSK